MKKSLLFLLICINCFAFAEAEIDFEVSKFCYLQPNVQIRGDVFYFPNQDLGITAKSLCVYKDNFGQYSSKGSLMNGKKDGEWKYWYKNGQVKEEVIYKNGQWDGQSKTWYKNGQKKSEIFYKNNLLSGPLTLWYENGQRRITADFNELRAGLVTAWYENGKMKTRGFLDFDKKPPIKEGLYNTWFENGNKQSQGLYRSNNKEFNWIYYYPNGQKRREGDYASDKKIGKWEQWNKEGNNLKDLPEGVYFDEFIPDETELERNLKTN